MGKVMKKLLKYLEKPTVRISRVLFKTNGLSLKKAMLKQPSG
jgi:hypothetical protein